MHGFWSNPVALQELSIFIDVVRLLLLFCVCVYVLLSSVSFPSHKPYLERYRIS